MKKITITTLAIAFIVSFVCQQASACGPNCNGPYPQKTEGEAWVNAYKSHGNENVGGESLGITEGSYKAKATKFVTGSADVKAILKGLNNKDGNKYAASKSVSIIDSMANTKQIYGPGEVIVKGQAGQTNWATVDKGDGNFASGYNSTGAKYKGKDFGPCYSASIKGSAGAIGETVVQLGKTSNSRSCEVLTKGGSYSILSKPGIVKVYGNGAYEGATFMAKNGATAGGYFSGEFAYKNSSPCKTAGWGLGKGSSNTSIVNSENSLKVSSHTKTMSKVGTP